MKIKMVLFDLDGTLLPMDQNKFMQAYFGGLAQKLAPHGYDPKTLVDAIWTATGAMVKNDGTKTNEEAFWERFCRVFGRNVREDEPYFNEYYVESFDRVKDSCGYDGCAAASVRRIKEMGLRVALATNPLFPSIATEKRIGWTGLSPDEFELFTTYENSSFCKPNLDYYRAIIKQLGISAEECLMVGNDVAEDMVAKKLGMKVFLLTDCLLNKNGEDISEYPQGSFPELLEYIDSL